MAKHAFHHQRLGPPKISSGKNPVVSSIWMLFLIGLGVLGIFLRPLRMPARLAILALSLWLAVGTTIYGAAYLSYVSQKQVIINQRASLLIEQSQWKTILASHPTAREALLGAYVTSLALGDNVQASQYKATLNRIDPNDARVKNLP